MEVLLQWNAVIFFGTAENRQGRLKVMAAVQGAQGTWNLIGHAVP